MSDDMFPRTIAFLVGGPADGVEQEVGAGVDILRRAEPAPESMLRYDDKAALPSWPSMRIHEYRPCAETGEWLWQGAR